jgi:two-component system OmpR family sensor kinase
VPRCHHPHPRGHLHRRWTELVPLWRSRVRMQRRLFVWFGVAIVATVFVVSGVTTLVETLTGAGPRTEWQGIRGLLSAQAARVWDSPEARDAWAGDIARHLSAAVELDDPQGKLLARFGPPARSWAVEAPVMQGGTQLGTVRLRPWAHDRRGKWMALLAVAAALCTLWAVSGRIAHKLAWPLVELTRVAQDLGDGKLQSRFDVRRARGEVRELGQVMNSMAERIEKQLKDQRELLAAVSHELRTPLARIRLLLEMGRSGDSTVFEQLEHEVLEMDALVGELLASARLDFNAMARLPLDGADLGARALERAAMPSTLLSVDSGGLDLEGDPTLLQRALSNLLENARVHAGGPSRLAVDAVDGQVRFVVEDTGPGLNGIDGEPFHPFQRGATSDGLGLGLALVRRIAEAHGGRAFAENRPEGGARVGFTVRARNVRAS